MKDRAIEHEGPVTFHLVAGDGLRFPAGLRTHAFFQSGLLEGDVRGDAQGPVLVDPALALERRAVRALGVPSDVRLGDVIRRRALEEALDAALDPRSCVARGGVFARALARAAAGDGQQDHGKRA